MRVHASGVQGCMGSTGRTGVNAAHVLGLRDVHVWAMPKGAKVKK